MKLLEQPFFFFDAQTTGIRPPTGHLIELGWASNSASGTEFTPVSSQRFELPENYKLPRKITELTGYKSDDFLKQPAARDWCESQFKPWLTEFAPRPALIHYAQFEIPYLEQLLGTLPFEVFCTHQITRRLFPSLPSQNIRAVSGYFGHPVLGPNRAGEFVKATQVIWRGLCLELEKRDICSLEDLRSYLSQSPEKKKRGYSYRIPDTKRLNLPDQPGIYRMLARNGEVLYVGKATSLHDRVNSYFRGIKGREKRKLEMLAQTWDLQVEVCGSPLEAALRESDEIKRLDPPYNVALKRGQRELRFYSRDFGSASDRQSENHPIGPFRPGGWIEMVTTLQQSLHTPEFMQIFFEPIDPQVMKAGFSLFLRLHNLPPETMRSTRSLLAYGSYLHRIYVDMDEEESSEKIEVEDEEREPTAEDLAGKFERLLRRAGGELRRSRRLTRILNSDVEFKHEDGWRKLHLREAKGPWPWARLGIDAYDRASVLLSELSRLEHRIHSG